jgi:flagellar basal body rod protein FlgG
MLATGSLEALQRIADRANDVLAAYAPGAVPKFGDVHVATQPLGVDDPLSVAAPDGAWFVTRGDHGTARTYTRGGGFHIGADGTLQSIDGARVLGTSGTSGALAPLRLPEPDRTLGRCTDLRIEHDGALAYTRASIDPRTRERTTERVIVGRVALARFPAGTQPQRIDATHFGAVAGVVPHVGSPADGSFGGLATRARDIGTVDINTSLQRLTDAYTAFAALQAANKAQGAGAKVLMDLLK